MVVVAIALARSTLQLAPRRNWPKFAARYKRVLVAIDGSPCGDRAAAQAGALARMFGSEVVLLHVRDIATFLRDGVIEAAALLDEERAAGERALDRAATALGGWPAERRMSDADPAEEIARAAADFDLVVMGSHGRRLLGRLILGSVSQNVLHRVSCAVLVVPCAEPADGAV